MSITINNKLLQATTHEDLGSQRAMMKAGKPDREVKVATAPLDTDALKDLLQAARSTGDSKTSKSLDAIIAARNGQAPLVPNFGAALENVLAFLRKDRNSGWIWARMRDGTYYPMAVTKVYVEEGHGMRAKESQTLRVVCSYFGIGGESDREERAPVGMKRTVFVFQPSDFVRRRVVDTFAAHGLIHETPELHAEYAAGNVAYEKILGCFAKQLRVTGPVLRFDEEDWKMTDRSLASRRVIHDLDSASMGPFAEHVPCELGKGDEDSAPTPVHPVVRVFDLTVHTFLWVNAATLTEYEYRKDLGRKLILPDSHRDLLDVLAEDSHALANDVFEGKVNCGVVLLTGAPGLGKTSTAEAYAELMMKPLYTVHSGLLGTSAAEVAAALKQTFDRVKRWGNCVCVINEVDVLIRRRGIDIQQNAIVAEILVALESGGADAMSFWTTNLPDAIDDAILSRVAAVIRYGPPDRTGTVAVWNVMSELFDAKLSDSLVDELASSFKSMAPREVKNLLRLTLRFSRSKGVPLTLGLFRKCAMFRAIEFEDAVVAT